jgi:thiol:disulfide interchange protein DsbD
MGSRLHTDSTAAFDRARRMWLLTLLAVVTGAAHALRPEDLLDATEAFRLSVAPLDAQSVAVTFRIADGYYMYRDRFRFEGANGQLLADVELPSGERKRDPFFGETETYRRQVTMRVPLSSEEVARGRVKLKITSQGCADVGVCYVPVEQTVEVQLPALRGRP